MHGMVNVNTQQSLGPNIKGCILREHFGWNIFLPWRWGQKFSPKRWFLPDYNCLLSGHYAACNGSSLPTFRDMSVPSPRVKNPRIKMTRNDCCDEVVRHSQLITFLPWFVFMSLYLFCVFFVLLCSPYNSHLRWQPCTFINTYWIELNWIESNWIENYFSGTPVSVHTIKQNGGVEVKLLSFLISVSFSVPSYLISGKEPTVFIERDRESVLSLWWRETPLSLARIRNTFRWLSSPQPSHYTDYAVSSLSSSPLS